MAQFDKLDSSARGRLGATVITDTAAHNNLKVGEIVAIEDTTFTSLVGAGWSGATFGGKTLKAGNSIRGYFSSIQLATGSVIAYNAE